MARRDDQEQQHEPSVTLPLTDLQKLLEGAATAAVKAVLEAIPSAFAAKSEQPVKQPTFEDNVKIIRGADRETPRTKRVPFVSEVTGARFNAVIVESRSHRNGRIVRLDDYEFPPGIDTYQTDGGLVPQGQSIRRHDSGQLTAEHKHWRWTEFYQPDLKAYVGKGYDPRRRGDAYDGAPDVAWEGTSAVEEAEEAAE